MNPIQQIIEQKVYAVVRVNNPKEAIRISKALVRGEIKIIELMIENAELIKAVEELKKTENILLAAGGIITERQATIAINAGADIIVSPIFQMNLVRLCKSRKIPLLMTATTPKRLMQPGKQELR